MSLLGSGPRRVIPVKISAVCVVQNLILRKEETVHVSRICNCCRLLVGNEVPKEILDLTNRTAAKYEVVEKNVDIGQNEEGIWLRVQCDGLPGRTRFYLGVLGSHARRCTGHGFILIKISAKDEIRKRYNKETVP